MYSSKEDLTIVNKAIADLVQGVRKVRVEYTDADGRRTSKQFTDVSLNELRALQCQMQNDLTPTPLMLSIDVEIQY